jgi:NAD(P)-dependent dehydrogenase (short-subunit alcohol dehydrogenase family)
MSAYCNRRCPRKRQPPEFGRLDILVNNAGVAIGSPAEDVREDDYDRMPAASLITGHTMLIDGGWTAR